MLAATERSGILTTRLLHDAFSRRHHSDSPTDGRARPDLLVPATSAGGEKKIRISAEARGELFSESHVVVEKKILGVCGEKFRVELVTGTDFEAVVTISVQ